MKVVCYIRGSNCIFSVAILRPRDEVSRMEGTNALVASLPPPTVVVPSSTSSQDQRCGPLLVASKVIIANINVSRTARRLEGSSGKCTGGVNVTVQGRCGGDRCVRPTLVAAVYIGKK
jgi:hypothetical protein